MMRTCACWVAAYGLPGDSSIGCRKAGTASPSKHDAIKGFGFLWQYTKAQEALMRTPPREADLSKIDSPAALGVMRGAASSGRSMLTEPEAKAVLAAYGITTVPTRIATSVAEVEDVARDLFKEAPSLAVKVLSEDLPHKSDVGGVELGLKSPSEAREAAEAIVRRVGAARPDARLQGFTVQPMIVRPKAHELIVGIADKHSIDSSAGTYDFVKVYRETGR